MLNAVLHHIGVSWMIETHELLKYDTNKHNADWITCGTCNNTSISEKLHGTVFGEYIRNARTDI